MSESDENATNYRTPAWVIKALLRQHPPPTKRVADLGAGDGAMVKPLKAAGYKVTAIEVDKKYAPALKKAGAEKIVIGDWLKDLHESVRQEQRKPAAEPLSLLSNPPYSPAETMLAFAETTLEIDADYVALLLPLRFFETEGRAGLINRRPPNALYPLIKRASFNGRGTDRFGTAWFVWDRNHARCSIRVLAP